MTRNHWSGMESLEPRLMLSGTLDNISELFIEQGVNTYPDGGPVAHSFEISFEVDGEGLIESARFSRSDAPDQWQAFSGPYAGGGVEEWFFEIETENPDDLVAYDDVEYVFEFTFTAGETLTTSLTFENPADGDPLVQPTQSPVFTSVFPHQSGVALDTLIEWESIIDPAVTSMEMELHLIDPADWSWTELSNQWIEDTSVTAADPVTLNADSLYGIRMLFDNAHEGLTAEGVDFFITKYTESHLTFNTFTGLLDPIGEVFIERGFDASASGGDGLYAFEFGLESPQTDWFTNASVTSPNGTQFTFNHSDTFDGGGYEWWFEFANTDEAALDDYDFGTYVLTLDLDGGIRVATLFDFTDPDTGGDLALPTDVPTLTTPGAGAVGVDIDVTFEWAAVTDPDIVEIELWVSGATAGEGVIDEVFGPEVSSHAQTALAPGQAYYAELSFFAGQDGLTNDDGVAFVVGTFRSAGSEFTTAGDLDPWALIDGVFIERGSFAPGDGADVEYEFEFGFFSGQTDWFEAAAVQVDGGPWYDLAAGYSPVPFESPDDGGEPFFEWYYEIESTVEADLAEFGAGLYTLKLTFADGGDVTTSFDFASDLVAPAQTPTFITPADGAVEVAPDVTLAWTPVTDPNAVELWLSVSDVNDYEWMIDESLDPSATEYAQNVLVGGVDYEAEIEIANGRAAINSDGVPYMSGYFSGSAVRFSTAGDTVDPFAAVDMVFLRAGQTAGHGAEPIHHDFEFGFTGSQPQWFETARFQVDGGPWYTLESFTHDQGYDWIYQVFTADEADLDAYRGATYTLELTFVDSEPVTTDFVFDSPPAIPTEFPTITSPADGAFGVDLQPTVTWDPITDPAASGMSVSVMDDQGGMWADAFLDATDTQFAVVSPLDEGLWYKAIVNTVGSGQLSNADGVYCTADFYAGSVVSFSTGDPLSMIDEVFIDRGVMPAAGDDPAVFFVDFGLGSHHADWFETADFQIDGGDWYALTPQYAPQGDYDEPTQWFEWSFEAETTDPLVAAEFGAGLYTLRLNLAGDQTVTTSFDISADLAATDTPPVFVAPLDGAADVAVDVTFAWEAPVDDGVNIVWLSVANIEDDWDLIDEDLSVSTTESPQTVLDADTTYEAELEFGIETEGVNADGVAFVAGMFTITAIEFATAPPVNPLTLIGGVYIERGEAQLAGGQGYECIFEMGFGSNTGGWLESARFQSPTGDWYDMTAETNTDGMWLNEWYFEAASPNVEDIAMFPAGLYNLELTTLDQSVVTTYFSFDAVIAPPAQWPEFISPVDGAYDAPVDLTLTWDSPAGAGVAIQWLGVEDLASGEDVVDEFLDLSVTSYSPSGLAPNNPYLAELAFANGYSELTNGDSVPYSVWRYCVTMIEFSTIESFDPLAMIDDVFIERGYIEDSAGAKLSFEFGFTSADIGWFDHARFQTPGGSWRDLTEDMDPYYGVGETGETDYEWLFEVESANPLHLLDFGFGTYVLELTSDMGQVVTTEFVLSADFAAPSSVPAFITPADGDWDVPVNAAMTWTPPSDDNVEVIWLDVVEADSGWWVVETDLDPTAGEFVSSQLQVDTTYEAELTFVAGDPDLTNADGVGFSVANYTARRIQFTTAGEFDPLAMIDDVFIERGVGIIAGAPDPVYFFEFCLSSSAGDWFDLAEFQVAGGDWYTLSSHMDMEADGDEYDEYGHEWFYEVFSDVEADVAAFGSGTYTLRLTMGQEQVVTDFLFDPSLTLPSEIPAFTSPTADEVVAPADLAFAWTPAAPGNVDRVEFGVMDQADQDGGLEADLDLGAVSYVPPENPAFGGDFEAIVLYMNGDASGVNDDGVPYTTYLTTAGVVNFSTVAATVDLAPEIVSVNDLPDPLLWGDGGTVTVDVTNHGTDTAEGQVTVSIYGSDDTVFDAEDGLLGSVAATVTMVGGDVETYTVDITLPDDGVDGEYYVLAVVTTDNAIAEDSTANNVDAGESRLVQTPAVDLLVSMDDISFEGRVLSGDSGVVGVTVTNAGTIPSNAKIVVKVYASSSPALEGAVQVGVASRTLTLGLDASTSFDVPAKVPAAAETGFYYLFAVVDPGELIGEKSELNNQDAWPVPVSVEAPVVDLVGAVTAVSYDGPVLPGAAGTLSLTVVNQGNTGSNKQIVTKVYASTTDTIGEDAVKVGQLLHTVKLAADGGTGNYTVNLKIPAGMAAGQYYLIADIDATVVQAESNEGNNTDVAATTVNVVAPVVDLAGTIVQTGFTGPVIAGASGTMLLRLTNDGNTSIIQKVVTVKIYLSESLDPTAGVLITTVKPTLTLAPETGSKDLSISLTLPADAATGDYYLLAVLDAGQTLTESNEVNNVVVPDATVGVTAQVIDLVAAIGNVALADPLLPGTPGSIAVTLTNQGNTPMIGKNVAVTVYGSLTEQVGQDAIVLGTLTRKVTLAAGDGSTVYNVALRIPADADFQQYNILVVADAAEVITEGDEANNLTVGDTPFTVVEPFVDLTCQITDVNFAGAVLPGDKGAVTVSVINNGNIPANGSVMVTLYASDDNVAGDDIELIQFTSLVSLAAGGSAKTFTKSVTIPAELEGADELYLVAVVEPVARITDGDDQNNTALIGGPEMDDPFRDLRGELIGFSMPEIVIAGDRSVAKVRLINDGNMPVVAAVSIGVYAQDIAGGDPILLGDAAELNLNLAPGGGAMTTAMTVEIPDGLTLEAEYQLFVQIDTTDAVVELDEDNNQVLLDEPRQFVQRFGTFEGHKNVSLTLLDEADEPVTFTLTGVGYGVVELSDAGGFDIDLVDTVAGSQARISTVADHVTSIETFETDGDLGGLQAPTTDLDGTMSFFGGLGKLVMNDVADQHVIEIGLADKPMATAMTFNDVTDLSIMSGSPIKSLVVNQWLDTDDTADVIDATWIGSLTSAGDFQADLLLSGLDARGDVALGSARIGGDIDAGAPTEWILLTGSVGQVNVGGTVDNFTLEADSAKTLTFNIVGDADITLIDAATSVTAASWATGTIDAAAVKQLRIAGDFGPGMELTGALGNARIGGDITGGTWTLGGLTGLNIAGAVNGWTLDLGVGAVRMFTVSDATDTTVIAGAIGVVKADSWIGGGFVADSIKTLSISGDFSGALDLAVDTGWALGAVKVTGDMIYDDLAATDWTIDGAIGSVKVAGAVEGFKMLASGTVKLFSAGDVTSASFGEDGAPVGVVKMITTANWGAGAIYAESLSNMRITGDSGAGFTIDAGDGKAFGTARIDGDITGGAWIITGSMGSLSVAGSINNWDLDLGDAALKRLSMGDVTNTNVTAGVIGTIKAASWLGGLITADKVGAATIKGDFSAGFELDGDAATLLGSLKVHGDLTGGVWDVDGVVGTISVVGEMAGGTLDVLGAIKSLTAGSIGATSITAGAVNRLTSKADMIGAAVTLTHPLHPRAKALGTLKVVGTLDSSVIRSVGSVGTATLGAMVDSVLFAGVRSDYADTGDDGVLDLPIAIDNYIDPEADVLAKIQKLTIVGGKSYGGADLFINSNVAAGTIVAATVKNVQTDNGETHEPFGFAAVRSLKVVWKEPGVKYISTRANWPNDTGDFTVATATAPPSAGEALTPWFLHR